MSHPALLQLYKLLPVFIKSFKLCFRAARMMLQFTPLRHSPSTWQRKAARRDENDNCRVGAHMRYTMRYTMRYFFVHLPSLQTELPLFSATTIRILENCTVCWRSRTQDPHVHDQVGEAICSVAWPTQSVKRDGHIRRVVKPYDSLSDP